MAGLKVPFLSRSPILGIKKFLFCPAHSSLFVPRPLKKVPFLSRYTYYLYLSKNLSLINSLYNFDKFYNN